MGIDDQDTFIDNKGDRLETPNLRLVKTEVTIPLKHNSGISETRIVDVLEIKVWNYTKLCSEWIPVPKLGY